MSDLSIPDPTPYVAPLDIQHDPEPAHEVFARRIPHIGHAALFFGIATFFTFVCPVVLILAHVVLHPQDGGVAKGLSSTDIHLAGLGQLLGYALTFAVAIPLFPLLWEKSFANGISWTLRAARLHWWKLVPLGIALTIFASVSEHFVHIPKDVEIMKFLDTPLSAWVTAISGALVAPIVEEIAFRGFLLPALAIAYDWMTLERSAAAYQRWRETTTISPMAWGLASVVSSVGFAALHGAQLHWPLGLLGILFCVSLVLCAVRIRLRSVASSALVHISYNGALFAMLILQTRGFTHLEKLAH